MLAANAWLWHASLSLARLVCHASDLEADHADRPSRADNIALVSQAENHSQLRAGLYIQSIAGTDVATMAYTDVLALMRAARRPVLITFVPELPTLLKDAPTPQEEEGSEDGYGSVEEGVPGERAGEAAEAAAGGQQDDGDGGEEVLSGQMEQDIQRMVALVRSTARHAWT